ncbi:hypothetical protein [Nonomuraea sp. NPDC050643]|uniref:hypothetical protein n=1 Tax=Nonomuraea sp. NPDC050643 TaxID=3155660 RepID=UPI0033EBAF0A
MKKLRSRVPKVLLVPLLLLVSIVGLQSPAYAGCQSVSFTFIGYQSGNYSKSCSGRYYPGVDIMGFRATGWSGYFTYTCGRDVPIQHCSAGYHEFCDWDSANLPTYRWFDGERIVTRQLHFIITELYLNATRPSRCN